MGCLVRPAARPGPCGSGDIPGCRAVSWGHLECTQGNVGVRSPSPPGSWAAAESFPRAQAAVSRPGPGSGAERALLHRIIWNCGARPDAQPAALRCEPQSPTRSGCAAVGSSETLSHRPWGPGPPSRPVTVTEGGVRETLPGGGPVLVLPVSSKHLAHHSCPDARSTAGGTL